MLGKDNTGLGIVEIVGGLVRGKSPVDRNHDGAQGRGSPEENEVVEAVFADHADAVTFFDTGLSKRCGHAVDRLFDLRKGCTALRFRVQPGRLVAIQACILIDNIVNGEVVHLHGVSLPIQSDLVVQCGSMRTRTLCMRLP